MVKYYKVPFGSAGDRTTVPNDAQVDGTVSYEDGYGVDYSKPRATDPDAKTIERDQFNEILFDLTENIQQYQQNGYPEFITTSDNGGTPYSYSKNAIVKYNNGSTTEMYMSTANSNTTLPTDTSKWIQVSNNSPFLNKDQIFSGVNTFSQTIVGSISGNAATATALATARNINGVSFNGTADITVTAAAGTLTGTTLNSSVVGSSLTSVGTLTGGATGTGFTVSLGSSTISGTLSGSNGGTNNAFMQFSGPAASTKTYTLPNASCTILTTDSAVNVTQGGTGATSFTAYAVLCGGTTSTSALQPVASVGTSGQVLTSNGPSALPTFQTPTYQGITLGTAQNSTSGSTIDFTSIPSTAKEITIMLSEVSTNGTGDIYIQLGDSGGVETTGYLGASTSLGASSVTSSNLTTGFLINSSAAGASISGAIKLNLLDSASHLWVASGVLGRSDVSATITVGGRKSTSGTLDRVRIATANTFDAGTINISYL